MGFVLRVVDGEFTWTSGSSGVFKVRSILLEDQALLFLASQKQKEHSIEQLLGCFIVLLMLLKFLCWNFRRWKIQSLFSQKVDGNLVFTDYWKFLVLNFSEMGNTVFFWAKELTKRWYLLITEKFMFWTFLRWEIQSFFDPKSWWKMTFL